VRNLTARFAVLLMLALMTIAGVFDYVRLVRHVDRHEQDKPPQRSDHRVASG
jgi:hypothetical protein